MPDEKGVFLYEALTCTATLAIQPFYVPVSHGQQAHSVRQFVRQLKIFRVME